MNGEIGVAGLERISAPDGSVEVDVLPAVGARLHRLRVHGHDLLRTPDDPRTHLREPIFWGAYQMAPWANRLDPGTFDVDGRAVTIAATFRDGTAMHGQVFDRLWARVGDGRWQARGGGDGWPWRYAVDLSLDVGPDRLVIELTLRNDSAWRMPGGVGLHPWFRRPVQVAIPAALVYPSNAPGPVEPLPVSGPFDLRRLDEMAVGLDATWTDLAEPRFGLRWPELRLDGTVTLEAPQLLVCAASATDLDATAIEPQTHASQGLRRLLKGEPDPMAWIDPGASLRLRIAMAFREAP